MLFSIVGDNTMQLDEEVYYSISSLFPERTDSYNPKY